MAKKVYYWTFSLLIAGSLLLSIAGYYLNPQVPGDSLTLWTMVTIFLLRPLFNYSLGALCSVKLFPGIKNQVPRMICLVSGILLTLLMVLIGGLELAGHPATGRFLGLFRQLFRAPGYFLIPGALLGFGLFKAE